MQFNIDGIQILKMAQELKPASEEVSAYEYLNVELELKYSGDMPEMYKIMLEMF